MKLNKYLRIKAARSEDNRAAMVQPMEGAVIGDVNNNIYDFFQGLRPRSVKIEHAIPQDEMVRGGKNIIRPRIAQRGKITNNDGSILRYSNVMPIAPDSTTVDDIENNRQKSTIGNADAELIYDYLRAGKNVPQKLIDDPDAAEYTSRAVWPGEIPASHGNIMKGIPSDIALSDEGKLGKLTNINYDKDTKGWKQLAEQIGEPWLYSDPKSYTMYKDLFGLGGGAVGGLGGYLAGSGVSRLLGWNKPRYKNGKDNYKSKRRWLKGLSTLGGAGLGIYLGRKAGQPWDEDHFKYEYDPSTARKNHKWLGESQYYKDRMNYALNRQLESDRESILANAKDNAVAELHNLLHTKNLNTYIK